MKHHLEKITNDNKRPGMPQEGWLVRYNFSDDFGWLSTRVCKSKKESTDFISKLNLGDLL